MVAGHNTLKKRKGRIAVWRFSYFWFRQLSFPFTCSNSNLKAMTSCRNIDADVVPSLLLFAMSAKLWIDYVCLHNRVRISDNGSLHSRREDADSSSVMPLHFEPNINHQPVEFPLESAEERRGRRNLRLSIDSPTFSEHHFHEGESSNPPKSPSRARRKNVPELNSVDEAAVDERSLGNSVMFLNSECPRWRELMERVSIADSVLTRVSHVSTATIRLL